MSFSEKIDVLDLIINVLNDHEKKFDGLVTRLEEVTESLSRLMKLVELPEPTTSPCDGCVLARGLDDGLVMNPGDRPGDCVWCTCAKLIKEHGYEAHTDEKYGYGTKFYKVGVLDDNKNCDYREAN